MGLFCNKTTIKKHKLREKYFEDLKIVDYKLYIYKIIY